MDTRFIIPVAIAAVIHAGALFSARSPKHAEPAKSRSVFLVPDAVMPLVDPELPAVEPEEAAPKGKPDTAPRTDDIARPDPTLFAQVMIPSTASNPSPLTTIPLEPVGLPNGDPNSRILTPGGIVNVIALDASPRTRSQVPPVYPQEARNDGTSAEVLVEFVVDESGRVLSPRIVRSSDHRFETATLRAVEKWRFEPGRVNGRIVRFRMMAPVVFSLAM